MTKSIINQSADADKPTRVREVVYGVQAIADAIDESDVRRVFYLLQRGHIPGARKIGRKWALSLRVFRRAMHGEAA